MIITDNVERLTLYRLTICGLTRNLRTVRDTALVMSRGLSALNVDLRTMDAQCELRTDLDDGLLARVSNRTGTLNIDNRRLRVVHGLAFLIGRLSALLRIRSIDDVRVRRV